MLQTLKIENIALIKNGEINFSSSLNIFSGETGSGKSIIVDAMNFMLGAKADKTLIRHGEDHAYVEGVFDIFERTDIESALAEIDIFENETLIISRRMTREGRNEVKLNGKTVTLSMLKSITTMLFDIHGQSEHFALNKISYHLNLVDGLSPSTQKIRDEFKAHYGAYKTLQKEIEKFHQGEERQRQIDLLSYQIEEIESAELKLGEEEDLERDYDRLSNMEKITTSIKECEQSLSTDGGACELLHTATYAFEKVSQFIDEQGLLSRLNSAKIELDDIFHSVRAIAQDQNYDEGAFDKIALRLDQIKKLKKKYGSSVEKILQFLEKAKDQLDMLQNAEEKLEILEKQKIQLEKDIFAVGKNLTEERKKSAKNFELLILEELNELGMENSTFEIVFSNLTLETMTDKGLDECEFYFSANKGEPTKPMIKIISGGEMSRFMLAIKNITATVDNIASMLFDEIDVGISGKIASLVAKKFLKLSKSFQVIAVTHLPQICAAGDTNFVISKSETDGKTFTTIKELSESEKLKEILRLTGGEESKLGIDYATSLLKTFKG